MVLQRKENILKIKSEKFGSRIAKMYLYLTSVKNETVMSNRYIGAGQASGQISPKASMQRVIMISFTN